MTRDELQAEIDRTPGLRRAIEKLATTGACGISPPIVGAMVRCGILSGRPDAGAKAARQALSLLEQGSKQ